MADINVACVSGNLTRDAEIRSTGSGYTVTSFTIASNERRKSPSGDWEDYPNFIDCTMFGKRGASLQPYLVKGTRLSVSGSLRYSAWEKDGQRRSKVELIVNEVMLPPRGKMQPALAVDDDIPF